METANGFSDIFGDISNGEGDIIEIYGGGENSRDDSIDASEVTYKLGIDYHLNNDVLLYANVSRGFKSGGFNGTWALEYVETTPYEGEELIAFEVGAKTTLLDGLMQLNVAAFDYDYTDMQVFGTDPQGRFRVSNAGDAYVRGLELDVWYRPIEGLDIKAAYGYNDNEYVEYRSSTDDFEGNRLPNSAKDSFSLLARYEFSIINASYRSKVYYQPSNTEVDSQDGYTLVNARLSLQPEDDKWEIALWVKNLNDKIYFSESFHSGSGGIAGRIVGAPRTYGVNFTYQI